MKQNKSTKDAKKAKHNSKKPSPSVGVEPVVRHKIRTRLLNIMVEKKVTHDEIFSKEVAFALREYANVLDKEVSRPNEQFFTANDCLVKIIHGSFDI